MLSKEYEKFGDEPLPPLSSANKEKIDGIISSVQLKSSLLRLRLADAAAGYFVHFARSQAFSNGNKRMSIFLTIAFLAANGHRLRIRPKKLTYLALLVAKDKKFPISTLEEITGAIFRRHLTKLYL